MKDSDQRSVRFHQHGSLIAETQNELGIIERDYRFLQDSKQSIVRALLAPASKLHRRRKKKKNSKKTTSKPRVITDHHLNKRTRSHKFSRKPVK
ncbi:hypothetical protein L1887_38160 [Cichorium endivia]|nr:hypothetical protein L1887_38160 [Cichorium endivia]